MILDLCEIPDDKKFEDLIVSYFEDLKLKKGINVVDVKVQPSGVGTDGGRDVLVTLRISDGIITFQKIWVVQCKFHASNISTNQISDINIPTLIHSYNASGYLLICREKPTSKLTDLFERLEANCMFKRKYIVWSGEQFKSKIIANMKILEQFFPNYYAYVLNLKK